MQVLKYASMQVCNYAGMQVFRYAGMKVCRYASMKVCRYASMQICKCLGLQICKYDSMLSSALFVSVAAAPKVLISTRWSPSPSSLELTLVCSAPAHPPAQILWYKSPHTLLTTAPGLTLGSSDQDTVWLQIPGVTSAALGSYTCQAINTIGQDSDMYYLSGRYHQLYMPGKALLNYCEI